MEKGCSPTDAPEPVTYPWGFYQMMREVQRGSIPFETLRAAFVLWAKQQLSELETEGTQKGLFDPTNIPEATPLAS